MIADLARWIVDVVYSFGYVGVGVLVALANLHLPIPTQIVLPFAGYLVSQGRFEFVPLLLSSTAGAVVASWILYYLGFWIGEDGLRRFVKRCERFKVLYVSDLDKASKFFVRHGGKAILIGHLVPGVGALISIPAGIKRMPIRWRFTIYTVSGSALWNAGFIILGWILGARWTVMEEYAPIFEYAALAVLILGIAFFVWHRWREYGKRRAR